MCPKNQLLYLLAMIAVLNLALTLLPGHPTYYQVPSALLAKTYSNSMMVLLNSRIKLGVMETLQSDDFDTTMHIRGITSTNPANDYELRDKPTETIILTEGASRPTSFRVRHILMFNLALGSINFATSGTERRKTRNVGLTPPKRWTL